MNQDVSGSFDIEQVAHDPDPFALQYRTLGKNPNLAAFALMNSNLDKFLFDLAFKHWINQSMYNFFVHTSLATHKLCSEHQARQLWQRFGHKVSMQEELWTVRHRFNPEFRAMLSEPA